MLQPEDINQNFIKSAGLAFQIEKMFTGRKNSYNKIK